jgi:hypothetical protein
MTKRVALMQPYIFPYLGYFQLINAADVFVLGDDLQYEKESWINRNRILANGAGKLISFPLKKDHHRARINQRVFVDSIEADTGRMLKMIANCYANAPAFSGFYPLLDDCLRRPERNLAAYAARSIRTLCDYLGIATPIRMASEFGLPGQIDKQDRVIRTVRLLGGETYINPIGGAGLYREAHFRRNGLTLRFHRMNDFTYRQFGKPFVPNLSIIDVLMFNGRERVREMLDFYTLLAPGQVGDLPGSPERCSFSGIRPPRIGSRA